MLSISHLEMDSISLILLANPNCAIAPSGSEDPPCPWAFVIPKPRSEIPKSNIVNNTLSLSL